MSLQFVKLEYIKRQNDHGFGRIPDPPEPPECSEDCTKCTKAVIHEDGSMDACDGVYEEKEDE